MAEWTTIPDDVLEPGKPIRSVDAIALRDNPVFVSRFVDRQQFDVSGTWNKPAQDGIVIGKLALVQVWGGGGGGGRGSPELPSGGGGGQYSEMFLNLADLDSSVTVTVGAGGVGRTGSSGDGTAGGSSSFGAFLTALGGAGGGATGVTALGGLSLGGTVRHWGGGSGLASGDVQQDSFFGGAGGSRTRAGFSVFGGAGGVGQNSAGTAPGGGGGAGTANQNGGNGAPGRVIVTVF